MKYFKLPFINKKAFKHRQTSCRICGESQYELLDAHRILEGGKYSNDNCVTLCTYCHRKHHSGLITIKGWFNSSAGSGRLLLYINENGEEEFV